MNVFEINSETGEVKLNGNELLFVNSIDLHIEKGDTAKLTINMDSEVGKTELAIEGDVKWYEK